MTWKNQLYFGDNLDILRQYIPDESVDLIYLDPPFNSKATYNVLFKEADGSASSSQIKAFDDTWHWDLHTEKVYYEIVEHGPMKLSDLTSALRHFLGTNDMMAYLVMMAARLAELHRVLKPTGSIYLHCDPTASHYLKLVMDAVFGPDKYANEIIWKRADTVKGNVGQGSKVFSPNTDTILFYRKTWDSIFHQPFKEYSEDYVRDFYRYTEPETGRRYRLISMLGPGGAAKGNPKYDVMGIERYWRYSKEKMQEFIDAGMVVQTKPGNVPHRKQYLDEGKGVPVQSLWDDIKALHSQASERLGYPTQKPEALLERIILTSSNEGDVVLDPFCGCGTTITVAERLKRRWIGIDVTHLAIALMKYRLENTFGNDLAPYEVIGEPKDLASAEALAQEDRFEFQKWAISLVEGMPMMKKGADKGIDGYIYFHDDRSGKVKKVMIEVKSGHVNSSMIRSLKGVVERENAQIGLLITLANPSREMVKEAATAGFYESENFGQFPRIQILTIEELFEGRRLEMPPRGADVTFMKPKKYEMEQGEQQALLGGGGEPT